MSHWFSGTYTAMTKLDLNERKQRLLMALVERHIRDGQPVGSKTLASGSGLTVSPLPAASVLEPTGCPSRIWRSTSAISSRCLRSLRSSFVIAVYVTENQDDII